MSFNSLAARSAVAIPRCALHAGATQKPKQPIVQQPAWRRHQAAAAGLAAAALLLAPAPALAMDLSYAPQSVKESMDARDEAAAMKCVQMFDCDGDRRDYAKKQWADFVARDGVPQRKAAAVTASTQQTAEPAESGQAE